jgi:hypothetical protein
MKYLVSGYCLVPVKAETVVDAKTPAQALKIAKARWKQGPSMLIVPGTDDESSAGDWRPTAKPQAD